jgi:hypothetical protein
MDNPPSFKLLKSITYLRKDLVRRFNILFFKPITYRVFEFVQTLMDPAKLTLPLEGGQLEADSIAYSANSHDFILGSI